MARDTNDLLKLQEDLLIEIFIRSTVTTLLRAKCVCKQWYALINNTKFTLSHLQYQKTHEKGRLLALLYKGDTYQYFFALFYDETLEIDTYHDFFYLVSKIIFMEGPIDGLYCLFDYGERIVLWNSVLMEFRIIPIPHPHFYLHLWAGDGTIGFGKDSLTHDYKLVLIRDFRGGEQSYSFKYVTVYNLTTNTWRLLYYYCNYDLFDQYLSSNRSNSFLNGCYYWWAHISRLLLAFDMGRETFRKILGPNLSDPSFLNGSPILYNDKLALLISNELYDDIWVMLEEGVWSKQFHVTSFPQSFDARGGLWKNNLLFFTTTDFETGHPNVQMVLCNVITHEMKILVVKADSCFQVCLHYDSLVSLDDDIKHKGKSTPVFEISRFLSCSPYIME